MKLLRRTLLFVLVSVCCFALGLSSLTASAASSQCLFSPNTFELLDSYISQDGESWFSPGSVTWELNSNASGKLNILNGSVLSHISYWRAKFQPKRLAGDLLVLPNMQLNATFYYQSDAAGQYANQKISGAMYLTAPNGSIYQFPVTASSYSESSGCFFVTVGGTANVADGFRFSDCLVEFVIKGTTTVSGVEMTFNTFSLTTLEYITENTVKIVESIDQGFADLQEQQKQNTQDIIDNQDSNTQDIIDNQDQNTQDIIDNQDSNTQDIIDNDNANAEKTHGFLQSIWDSIVALPQQIWQFIEDGLKKLFVPDADYIESYKGKWETLLSSRFGAVYEAFDILIDWARGLRDATKSNYVSIPSVTIPLPDNNSFSFGPYQVNIVPEGLSLLADTSKTITAIISVLYLINALRKRWEEIMGVN